jgi:hypothetical protein
VTKNEIDLDNTKYEKINAKGEYAIKFDENNVTKPLVIDIAHKDIHVLLRLKIEEHKTANIVSRFVIVTLLVLFGICIPFTVCKIIRQI